MGLFALGALTTFLITRYHSSSRAFLETEGFFCSQFRTTATATRYPKERRHCYLEMGIIPLEPLHPYDETRPGLSEPNVSLIGYGMDYDVG